MCYKAFKLCNLKPDEVLHVGDSLSSDVIGAQNIGIKVAWINRKNKDLPQKYSPDFIINSLSDLLPMLT